MVKQPRDRTHVRTNGTHTHTHTDNEKLSIVRWPTPPGASWSTICTSKIYTVRLHIPKPGGYHDEKFSRITHAYVFYERKR